MRIEIRDLHASVEGKQVLGGLSLTINPGELHALMGPNGSGKSTLSFVIAGHPKYAVTKGDVLVDGKSILGLSPAERARLGIFLSFQQPPSIEGVSMFKFLFALAKARQPGLSVIDFNKRLDANLAQIGLDRSFVERDVNAGFSGGERKRAEMLQLLTLGPSFVILDELDSGLDVDSLRALAQVITGKKGPDFSALVVTHYPRILEYLKPDVVHVLQDGKIVASGDMRLAVKVEEEGYARQ